MKVILISGAVVVVLAVIVVLAMIVMSGDAGFLFNWK